MDFVEICNVYVAKMIIKAAKRIFNSDKICRSYSDLNFGVTFLEHGVEPISIKTFHFITFKITFTSTYAYVTHTRPQTTSYTTHRLTSSGLHTISTHGQLTVSAHCECTLHTHATRPVSLPHTKLTYIHWLGMAILT